LEPYAKYNIVDESRLAMDFSSFDRTLVRLSGSLIFGSSFDVGSCPFSRLAKLRAHPAGLHSHHD
jgi:hypothetical protein